MQTRKLEIGCPECGSKDVFYSCTPNCCFNHVCGNCSTTFEPATETIDGKLDGIEPPDPLPDATDPTAACAACESTAVYQLAEGGLVCADCGSRLKLELTEVAPG